jgi:phosphohistidine phosphatase SixA
MKTRVGVCGVVALMMALAFPLGADAQTVILVRHAERADGGAAATGAAMQGNPDPELSPAGKARAQVLASMLRDVGIAAIYVTQYVRTRDTAKPLADALRIMPEIVQSRDMDTLVAKIKAQKGYVLVVGHSNSVPAVIKALGGPEITIADDEYDNLFILPVGGTLTRLRFRQ